MLPFVSYAATMKSRIDVDALREINTIWVPEAR